MSELFLSRQQERRQHHTLREIFPAACRLLAPMVGSAPLSDFSVMHVLREQYPQLSSTEVQVMVTAIQRLQREGRLNDAL